MKGVLKGNTVYCLGILVLLTVLASAVSFADNETEKFRINEIEVKVDGDSDTGLTDGDRIGDEALPESTVKVEVEVENLYTRSEDIEVKDVDITVTIEGIDEDDDDLEEEVDRFDLKPSKKKSKSVTFDLPLRIDEGDYDVVILVEAEDENDIEYSITWTITLEVEKENHELRLFTVLNPPTLECNEDGLLDIEVLNLGQDEEEEVKLEVKSAEFDIDFEEVDIVLDYDLFDDDSSYSTSIPFTVPEELEAGSYRIQVKAYYDDTKLSDTELVDVTVSECSTLTTTTIATLPPPTTTLAVQEETVEEGTGVEEGEEEQVPIENEITTQAVTDVSSKSDGISPLFLLLVLLGGLILVAATVVVTVMVLKKD